MNHLLSSGFSFHVYKRPCEAEEPPKEGCRITCQPEPALAACRRPVNFLFVICDNVQLLRSAKGGDYLRPEVIKFGWQELPSLCLWQDAIRWFDRARVMRVLARIISDLDELARQDPKDEAEVPEDDADPLKQHRRRLAEAEEKPRSRNAKEQREVLRQAFGLPHYSGDYAEYFRHMRGE